MNKATCPNNPNDQFPPINSPDQIQAANQQGPISRETLPASFLRTVRLGWNSYMGNGSVHPGIGHCGIPIMWTCSLAGVGFRSGCCTYPEHVQMIILHQRNTHTYSQCNSLITCPCVHELVFYFLFFSQIIRSPCPCIPGNDYGCQDSMSSSHRSPRSTSSESLPLEVSGALISHIVPAFSSAGIHAPTMGRLKGFWSRLQTKCIVRTDCPLFGPRSQEYQGWLVKQNYEPWQFDSL